MWRRCGAWRKCSVQRSDVVPRTERLLYRMERVDRQLRRWENSPAVLWSLHEQRLLEHKQRLVDEWTRAVREAELVIRTGEQFWSK